MSTDKEKPKVERLEVEPDGYWGWGIYEPIEFTVTPIWSDGVSDLDCRRADNPPKWEVENYGKIEGARTYNDYKGKITRIGPLDIDDDPYNVGSDILNYGPGGIYIEGKKEGRQILYRTGHSDGEGKLKVTYGGITKIIPIVGKKCEKNDLVQDYHYHVYLDKVSLHEQSESDKIIDQLQHEITAVKKFKQSEDYDSIEEEVYDFSNKLEKHIRRWLDGRASAKIPKEIIPKWIRSPKHKNWTLKDPNILSEYDIWHTRGAFNPEFKRTYIFAPEPYCSYNLITYMGPIGSKLIFEGEFPHCRFMDIQMSPPLDPRFPLTGGIGAAEIPIVDSDIDPLPGHINPFRVGADRTANNRSYRVEFELAVGNAVELNPEVMVPPYYRASSNSRKIGPCLYTGFIGDGSYQPGIGWMRYYAPDKGTGPLAGVPLPKISQELSSGEEFIIWHDWALSNRRVGTYVAAKETSPIGPTDPPEFIGNQVGWQKLYGLHLVYVEVFAQQAIGLHRYGTEEEARRLIPEWDKVMYGRGPNQPPPGNYEISCTTCTYINYLVRILTLGKNKVYALTGKLPKTPKTRDGNPIMESAEARYWSMTRIHETPGFVFPAVAMNRLMDEDVIVDDQQRYVIAFSREEDRPSNATEENGITWQAWGPDSINYCLIRWLSISPDWILPEYAPNDKNIAWTKGSWSQPDYDKSIIGENKPGFLGPYHPIIHYMSKEEFEDLGDHPKLGRNPNWKDEYVRKF
ncbi:MAG: hypothetical protein GF317_09080 [Candidatus Lokiarchaeota archaeon]|nr:hypothetical protein [Candidatus Lokiarchaeota archaeon]MBD3199865.1 hypothetical protein [Candidatus Lokiarchaeota archaeon]